MGVSTDAILFFGYVWTEQGSLIPAEGDGDQLEWVDVVLRKRGVVDPWNGYPSEEIRRLPYPEQRKAGDVWVEANREAIDRFHEEKKKVEAEFGCDIGWHCSGDYSMPYVAVDAGKTRARRGYPVAVEPARLAVEPAWEEMLERFLKELGIARPEGQTAPAWWLVSYWG